MRWLRRSPPPPPSLRAAAARALMTVEGLSAEEVAERSMQIAADICVYTNHSFAKEVIEGAEEAKKVAGQ